MPGTVKLHSRLSNPGLQAGTMRRGLLFGVSSLAVFATVIFCLLPDTPTPVRMEGVFREALSRQVTSAPKSSAVAAPATDVMTEANRGDTRARSRMCADSMSSAENTGRFSDAAYWCALAAEAGDASSQAAYARLYQLGAGVAEDDAQAAFWYDKAIAQRDAHAMYMRGRMLMASPDAADDARARVLLEEAAALGNPGARWTLQELAELPDARQERSRILIR